jgi:hypothetical protein
MKPPSFLLADVFFRVPEALKSEGNIAFVEKNYEKAIEIYTEQSRFATRTLCVTVGGGIWKSSLRLVFGVVLLRILSV